MFDGDSKIFLFLAAAIGMLGMVAADQHAPRAALSTALDVADLPPLPAAAAANGAPAQTRIAAMDVPLGDGFEARLMYGYVLEGRVVTRREFRNDATSAISPLDLGIVWGDLAAPGNTDGITFTAVPRGVNFRPTPGMALADGWEEQVTNNHLIPANQAIQDALLEVPVGAQVRLSGYLVVVTGDGIAPWRSSTRRNDNSVFGGCEIILVTDIEILGARGKEV